MVMHDGIIDNERNQKVDKKTYCGFKVALKSYLQYNY